MDKETHVEVEAIDDQNFQTPSPTTKNINESNVPLSSNTTNTLDVN